jgi:hypothetical protein
MRGKNHEKIYDYCGFFEGFVFAVGFSLGHFPPNGGCEFLASIFSLIFYCI